MLAALPPDREKPGQKLLDPNLKMETGKSAYRAITAATHDLRTEIDRQAIFADLLFSLK
jgi:hypothetical protein